MTLCEVCGKPIAVGEFPCISTPREHAPYRGSVEGDDIIGGFVQEHFGHEPEVFYSKKAMARRAKELGLRPFVRHVDGDKHVTKWV